MRRGGQACGKLEPASDCAKQARMVIGTASLFIAVTCILSIPRRTEFSLSLLLHDRPAPTMTNDTCSAMMYCLIRMRLQTAISLPLEREPSTNSIWYKENYPMMDLGGASDFRGKNTGQASLIRYGSGYFQRRHRSNGSNKETPYID